VVSPLLVGKETALSTILAAAVVVAAVALIVVLFRIRPAYLKKGWFKATCVVFGFLLLIYILIIAATEPESVLETTAIVLVLVVSWLYSNLWYDKVLQRVWHWSEARLDPQTKARLERSSLLRWAREKARRNYEGK
jgi:hypothetical protein